MNDTLTPRNDQPTYAMLADMRDRVLLAEAELAAMKEQRDRLAAAIRKHKDTLHFTPDFSTEEIYKH